MIACAITNAEMLFFFMVKTFDGFILPQRYVILCVPYSLGQFRVHFGCANAALPKYNLKDRVLQVERVPETGAGEVHLSGHNPGVT